MAAEQPIIRRVVKKARRGHHGGSWKVAYADFVTAMMAFFLVMWILSLDQPNQKMIADYFNDPGQFMREYRKDPAGFVKVYRGGNNPLGKGVQAEVRAQPSLESLIDALARKKFEATRKDIEKAIAADPDLRGLRKYVDIRVTDEGLKIELLEVKQSLFFQSGSARVEPKATRLLTLVARKLSALSHRVAVEGHTDVVPYHGRSSPGYGNWELSADRANAARRVMESALRPGQVTEVRGYAATKLRDRAHPRHFSNRRVSILVPFG